MWVWGFRVQSLERIRQGDPRRTPRYTYMLAQVFSIQLHGLCGPKRYGKSGKQAAEFTREVAALVVLPVASVAYLEFVLPVTIGNQLP